jgi:hypothetical protein
VTVPADRPFDSIPIPPEQMGWYEAYAEARKTMRWSTHTCRDDATSSLSMRWPWVARIYDGMKLVEEPEPEPPSALGTAEGGVPVSPRVIPKHEQRDSLPSMGVIPVGTGSSDSEWVGRYVAADALERQGRCTSASPYQPGCSHSFYHDLLLVAEADARSAKATESPILRGRDPGAADFSDVRHGLAEARERLRTTVIRDRGEARDLSSGSAADMLRPSTPAYLSTIWGRASRSVGTLAAALEVVPLEAGMVDTSGGVPIISVPRITGGSGVAVQSSQNAAVQETDPSTGAATSPVSTISGMVDVSRQLFELSNPSIDGALTDDLARAHAASLDVEIVSGSASGGRTRGLLNWSGILSVSGSVTNAQTTINSIWQGYSALSGASGYGVSDTSAYLVVMHPRRLAWLSAGISGVMPPAGPLLPGTVVPSMGIPSTLGAGTHEDVIIIIERSQALLLSDGPHIRLFEAVGSGTLTIRVRAAREAALVVLNPAAICKVTGMVAPAGF